jgi:hypothetical protein
MLILSEFLDSNCHRSYPFTNINDIPTDFLVDAKFMVTGNVEKTALYISNISVTDTNITINLAVKIDGVMREVGTILSTDIVHTRNKEYSCKLVNNDLALIIEGFITIGTVDTIERRSYNFKNDIESYNIFSGCVIPVTEWCTGINIDGTIYTGIVNLMAGEGISFETTTYNGVSYITIKAEGFERPSGLQLEINSEDELFDKLNNLRGNPICSINGVLADDTGNINIGVDEDSKQYLEVKKSESENSIMLSDIHTSICTVLPEDIATLHENIQSLNERASVLDKMQYSLENQVNSISLELTKIDFLENE